jgi:hypothetical protein
MKINVKKNRGNIVLMAIVVSAMIIGFGISLTTVLTTSIISIKNISESTKAYYMAESGAEIGYYIFSGHGLGFEYNYDNDSTCEIESGEDLWCLSSRINSVPREEDTFNLLMENGVVSVGLYNDISDNPYGSVITSNVALSNHDISIMLYSSDSHADIFNNTVGAGDIRVTSIIATSSITYDGNTRIEKGEADIGTSLVSNLESSTTCYQSKYAISGVDQLWDAGEFVYRDIDLSQDVSEGDIRMNSTGIYGAGTTVTMGDSDIGIPLKGNGIENLACAMDNPSYLYSTDIAQIIISGRDDDGNKSISRLLSKNQLASTDIDAPLVYTKNMTGNVGTSSSCDIQDFMIKDSGVCGNVGDMTEPQLEIYALSGNLYYRIESTFSDFYIDNTDDSCTICQYISIAGQNGTSTDFNYRQISESPVATFSAAIGDYFLRIGEYGGAGVVTTSAISVTAGMTLSEAALLIQDAISNTVALKNNYSVSYRDGRFQIVSTGITLTNPEITLQSKGIVGDLEQSIQTSITDSSLVPIFGWYSVF